MGIAQGKLAKFNQGEGIGDLIKKQEELFKNIDSRKFLEKIRRFRELNIQDMEEQELRAAIFEAISWNGKFSYITNIKTYPIGTFFFRIRRLNGKEIPNTNLDTYGDFWEPPEECVKKEGRLNKKGESLLYVTPEEPRFLLKELHIVEGEYYALIKYRASRPVKMNVIGGQYDYNAIGFTDNTAMLNHDILNDFFREEFSRDVGQGTEYHYKVSEIIAKSYFDLPPEKTQDAWGYSSIQDKEKYNVCFRPNIAHKLLKLEGALLCKKEECNDMSLKGIALGSEMDNKVYFYPLGSEQQRRVFPEVVL